MPERRQLRFQSLEDVEQDCRMLMDRGYTALGQWNLAQICLHLNEWMRYPMDGYPKPFLPLRPVFWLIRLTMGRRMLKKILREGFKPGSPTLGATAFAPDSQPDLEAVNELVATVRRMQSHNGGFHRSLLFGDMTQEEVQALQRRHCEHHLSFLVPRT